MPQQQRRSRIYVSGVEFAQTVKSTHRCGHARGRGLLASNRAGRGWSGVSPAVRSRGRCVRRCRPARLARCAYRFRQFSSGAHQAPGSTAEDCVNPLLQLVAVVDELLDPGGIFINEVAKSRIVHGGSLGELRNARTFPPIGARLGLKNGSRSRRWPACRGAVRARPQHRGDDEDPDFASVASTRHVRCLRDRAKNSSPGRAPVERHVQAIR